MACPGLPLWPVLPRRHRENLYVALLICLELPAQTVCRVAIGASSIRLPPVEGGMFYSLAVGASNLDIQQERAEFYGFKSQGSEYMESGE